MSRTIELLDRATGLKTRRLLLDAKEAVANDPERYAVIGAPVKTDLKAVAEYQGNNPHSVSVGKLKFEPR